jgi:L-ribulokinase
LYQSTGFWYQFKLFNKETNLVALDWWNGCRTPLSNSHLTGVIAGLTLHTAPEEIYLALIEATAYGTKKIIETFVNYGIPIEKIVISGGIAKKNKLITQIYSNILNREVFIADTLYPGALGASIYSLLSLKPYSNDIIKTIQTFQSKTHSIIQPEEKMDYYSKKYVRYLELFEFFKSK